MMKLLYEDKHLCLAVKPTGVLSEDHPTKACMPALLRGYFQGPTTSLPSTASIKWWEA